MTKFRNLFLLSFIALFLCSACQDDLLTQKDDGLKKIPADVSMITSINTKQLMEKADYESIKEMEFFQEALRKAEKENPAVAAVLKNPEQSGIDLDKNIYVTYKLNPKNPGDVFMATIATLKNQSDFEDLVNTLDQGAIKDKGDYKTISSSSQTFLAWTDEIVIAGGSNSSYMDIDAEIKNILNTDKETSVASNKDLQKAFSGNHDIAGWMNSDPLADNPQAGLALNLIDISPKALAGNSIHNTVDFENGAIVGHSKFFFNDEIGKDFIGKFFKDEVKTDFSKYLPAENLIFAATAALDIRGVDEFLSLRPQSKGMVDFALKESGLTMKDLVSTFGGDIMVAGFGGNNILNGNGLFSTNIKNTEKLNAIIDAAIENNVLVELSDNHYKVMTVGMAGGFSISRGKGYGQALIHDGLLFFSNDEALLTKIKEGGFNKGDRAPAAVLKMLKNNTFASHFGIEALKKMDDDFADLNFTDMKLNVKGDEADFKLDLKDDSKNSLKAIFEMINEAYLKNNRKIQ